VREVEVEVRNPSGLHARPAALFVKTAATFGSTVTIENLTRGTAPANAKSILGVLTAGVAKGHRIRVVATGADEDAAVDAMRGLVEDGVGEALG
jgi:phosphotransferase system HPr (HPr) family protein